MNSTSLISDLPQTRTAIETKPQASLFFCRATEIALIVTGILMGVGATIAFFQGVGTIAVISLAIGSSAFLLGGIITVAIHACKKRLTENVIVDSSERPQPPREKKVDTPKIRAREISPLEFHQRKLLKNPDNNQALVKFSSELIKSVTGIAFDGDKSLKEIAGRVRPFIKFFDFELIQKVCVEVDKDTSVNFQLSQYLGFYRGVQKDLLIKRSNSCLQEIKRQMEPGEYLGTTSDNGDCYYESLAQGLTLVLGRLVTTKELRQHVYNFIRDNGSEEWLQNELKKVDADYPEAVQWTYEECSQFNATNPDKEQKSPVWGVDEIDLCILLDIYKVRYIALDAQWDDEKKKVLPSATTREIVPRSDTEYEKVVKIAFSEHHCYPILKDSP